MEIKTRLILVMLLIFIISSNSLRSQNLFNTVFLTGNAIGNSVTGERQLKFQRGEIHLANDTLWGKVLLENSSSFKNGIIFNSGNAAKDSIILLKDIIKVIIYKVDTTVVKEKETNFINVGGEFYRLLFKNQKIEIYDKTRYSDEFKGYVGKEFYIKDLSKVKNIEYSGKSKQNSLVDYVNLRYDKNFTKKDFKSRIDIINYIVESENKSGK